MCEDVDWIHLPQNRIQWRFPMDTVMNLLVPSKAGNFLIIGMAIIFSRKTVPWN